jgi:DNA-binding transcriptional LysR family regulator
MIESSQVNVLMALAESNTLSQAAEKLNVTQSAVSQNLKSLESKVGFPVVSRHGKKLVLTSGGKKLAKLGRAYFRRFDDLINEIQQDTKTIVGEISLGTMYGLGKSWIASRMIEFSSQFPDLRVQITMDFPETLLKKFDSGDLNCLILPTSLVPAYSEHRILHNEYATLVFPDSADYKIDHNTSLKEIMNHPLIFFQHRDPLFYNWCKERFGQIPRNVQPRLVVNSFGQIMQAVHEGLGIAVIPTHVLRRSFFKDKIKNLGKKHDIQSEIFQFIYHSEDKESIKMNTLFDFLVKELEKFDV